MKAATKNNGFTLRQASRHFNIPLTTLHNWLQAGQLRVLKQPQRRGQSLLVDAASILEARQFYSPRTQGRGDRGGFGSDADDRAWNRTGGQLTPSAPLVEYPTIRPAPRQGDTGDHLNTRELVLKFQAHNASLSPYTVANYRCTLQPFIERFPTLPLEPEPIDAFLAERPHSAAHQHNRFKVVRIFYGWLWKRMRIANPFYPERMVRNIREPKVLPRFLEREEIARVFAQAASFQERVMLELFITTGIRGGELSSLERERLFPAYVRVEGKTGPRDVDILPFVYEHLKALAASHNHPTIFYDRNGKRMRPDGLTQRVRKCMLKAGITGRKLGPHLLRHSFGHIYQQEKGDLVALQQMLGHTMIETTRKYAQLSRRDVRQKYLDFDPGSLVGGRR